IFKLVPWTLKEENICQLFLLNLFEALLPVNCSLVEVKEQLEKLGQKLNKHIVENPKSKLFFEYQLEHYLNWKIIFNTDKTQLFKELDRSDVNKIIFKSKFGFAKITTLYDNEINVESVLGFYNNDTYEIKDIKNGKKGIMYYERY